MSPKTDAAHRQIEQTVHIEQTGQIVRCKPVKKPPPPKRMGQARGAARHLPPEYDRK